MNGVALSQARLGLFLQHHLGAVTLMTATWCGHFNFCLENSEKQKMPRCTHIEMKSSF